MKWFWSRVLISTISFLDLINVCDNFLRNRTDARNFCADWKVMDDLLAGASNVMVNDFVFVPLSWQDVGSHISRHFTDD